MSDFFCFFTFVPKLSMQAGARTGNDPSQGGFQFFNTGFTAISDPSQALQTWDTFSDFGSLGYQMQFGPAVSTE